MEDKKIKTSLLKSILINKGQTTVEYLLVLSIAMIIAVGTVRKVSTFMGDSFGRIAHVLSMALHIGVCPNYCFYQNYVNGRQ